jgi:hypothetical protein
MRITLEQLNRAHYHVMGELESLGLFSSPMSDVEVFLVPFSWTCYGWQNYGGDGAICIPSISVANGEPLAMSFTGGNNHAPKPKGLSRRWTQRPG